MTETNIFLILEQLKCDMPLSEWCWLVANSASRHNIKSANLLIKVFGKIWLKHKNFLIPPHSLLKNLLQALNWKNWTFPFGGMQAFGSLSTFW